MTLGTRIREYRIKRGFTQGQMADKLSMTEANFSSYERDKSVPPSAKLLEISAILNISTDYLLGRTDVPEMLNPNNTNNSNGHDTKTTSQNNSPKDSVEQHTAQTQKNVKTVIYVDEGELIDLSSYSETEKQQIKDFIKFIKSQKNNNRGDHCWPEKDR
jgi:transcriptional regulator with XRE-family HTH domain